MKVILSKVFIFTMLLTFVNTSFGQTTNILNRSYFITDKNSSTPPLVLGQGFHINDVYRATRTCFTSESINPKNLVSREIGSMATQIRVFYTKNEQEYNSFKSNGISGKVSFLNLFSLGGKKLEEFATKKIEETERLIFVATVDFGYFSFEKDPKLTFDAKNLIEKRKNADFINLYGTHYISGIRKQNTIYVVLSNSSNVNSNSINTTSSTSTSGKVPLKVSASGEIENSELINNKLSTSKFEVFIDIKGPQLDKTSLQENITKIIYNNNIFDKKFAITNIINQSIIKISDPNNGYISQYYYAPFSLYGLSGINWDDSKESQLIKINETIVKVYGWQSKVSELISESGRNQIKNINKNKTLEQQKNIMKAYEDVIPNLQDIKQKTEIYLDSLREQYSRCSDITCQSKSLCCKDISILNEINNSRIDKKIQDEINQVNTVIKDVYTEINKPECEKQNCGVIVIYNSSSNPYDIYQGDNLVTTIYGNSKKELLCRIGDFSIKAKQKSGYVMYPTVNLRSGTISSQCQKINLRIGFKD